ncbi:MAG: PepSY domain-containing protein [Iamia sp.]
MPEATTEAAWATFIQGVAAWGPPAGVLSDNGLCFSGKLRGFEVLFEANLRDAGIHPRTGRPYHPQTTGKVERFQQTLKKWLRRQRLARDLAELQAQLDAFCSIYNHQRPHQGIGAAIPADRWNATLAARPADRALAHPDFTTHRFEHRVKTNGTVRADGLIIHIGVEWAGNDATVLINTRHATGSSLTRASEVALDAMGGGRVTGTEVGDEDSYYEVEVTAEDGTQVDVQLDREFNVVSSLPDDEGPDTDDEG